MWGKQNFYCQRCDRGIGWWASDRSIVVDDDDSIRDMLSLVLHDKGYLVKAVENGKKAVKACEESPFDVTLIDVELPDMKVRNF